MLGLTLVLVAVPLRVLSAAVHRQYALGEPFWSGVRVGLSLVPTLVFTIVLADILRERFQLADELYGALIVFALLNTALPGLFLRATPPEFAAPEIPRTMATTPPPSGSH